MKEFHKAYALNDYELAEAFRPLYEMLLNSIEQMKQGERVTDFKHYVFEEAIKSFAWVNEIPEDEFWDFYNSLPGGLDE